ncbi:LysR substrate-binding domain-containing protein [Streptomyces sp. NPDC005925]|uniref:LysR substrate-binding domain-containing protein n=1 Tax=Streptomyces sp. NPDC005925 TaxID=3157172 RepID=UPI0033CC9089
MTRWKRLPEGLPPEVVDLIGQLRAVKDVSELTLAALASRTAYSRSTWERYLNGKRIPPREAVRSLAALAGPEEVKSLLLAWEKAMSAQVRMNSTLDGALPTSEGQLLVAEDHPAVEAGVRLQPATTPLSRPLRVGCIGGEAAMPYTQQVLTEYQCRYPESAVEVHSVDFAEQVDALTSVRVDAAFLRLPLPSHIHTLPLAREPRVVCMPADDPLLARQPLTLKDLAGRVFIDVAGDGMRAWWDYWQVDPRPDGSRVSYGPVVTDIEPLLLAVSQGRGIAFLPAAARDLYPRPGVAYGDLTGVPVTTAALAWLPHHQHPDVAALREAAQIVADRHVRTVRGHIRIGSLGAEGAMPYAQAILGQLRGQHPELDIEVRNLSFGHMFSALTSGEVDAAFLRGPLPAGIQSLHLATETRVVCLSADHPLADREVLTLAELANCTVVDMPPEVPRFWWDHLTMNPRPDGSRVRYGPVVRDTEAMVLAVTQAQAITFLPSAARLLYPRPGLVYINAPELGVSTAVLAWLPRNYDQPAISALRAAAHHIVPQEDLGNQTTYD